ncbi:MAG: EamA family transporter [Candidatus Eisenbacteria bacterium]|nr:EamA family transporter [Candidatus Latescibacterota bacterium]MBD3300959.1 EamA family transporter [Candidatus Eisenbacteria bacterium]
MRRASTASAIRAATTRTRSTAGSNRSSRSSGPSACACRPGRATGGSRWSSNPSRWGPNNSGCSRRRGASPEVAMQAYLFLTAALTLNALANVLIKYAMVRHPRPFVPVQDTALAALSPYLSYPFVLGILCFALNLGCYSLALRSLRISLAYPLMVSLGYIVILVFGWFLFGERLTAVQYAGIGLILIGLWLVVR